MVFEVVVTDAMVGGCDCLRTAPGRTERENRVIAGGCGWSGLAGRTGERQGAGGAGTGGEAEATMEATATVVCGHG